MLMKLGRTDILTVLIENDRGRDRWLISHNDAILSSFENVSLAGKLASTNELEVLRLDFGLGISFDGRSKSAHISPYKFMNRVHTCQQTS